MKTENKTVWYQNNYFIVFCFLSVVFIPLGVFLVWKFKDWEIWLKTLLTGLFAVLFVTSPFIVFNMVKSFYNGKKEEPISITSDVPKKSSTESDLNTKNKIKKEKSSKKSESKKSKTKKSDKKDNSKEKVVYITKSGKKYHSKNSCGRGKFTAIGLDEALSKGYLPCKKCFK